MADLNNFGETIGAQFRGLSGRHPGQWPVVPRLLCAAGVFAVLLIAAWFGVGESQVQTLDDGAIAEGKLRDEYKSKYQQAVNLDALIAQRAQVEEYVKTMQKQLPSKSEMAALLQDISSAGTGRGLQFDAFEPGQVVVRDYYAELPIEIKVSGRYHDIGTFSADIAALSRIVTLNNLNLNTGKDGGLTLAAVAKTFRYLDPEEVADQRKRASEKKAAEKGAKK